MQIMATIMQSTTSRTAHNHERGRPERRLPHSGQTSGLPI